MNKFTVFTVILAVSVITVTINLVMRDLNAKLVQTNVTGATNNTPTTPQPTETQSTNTTTTPSSSTTPTNTPEFIFDTGSQTGITAPQLSINSQIVTSAGFPGILKEETFSGKVFELFDITSIPVQTIGYFTLNDSGTQIVSITEVKLPDEIRALQLYMLIQNRTKTYIDLSINETNAYGDRSFYINHAKKPDEAFLTVKIGKSVYSFAYIKTYHDYLKELIKLLTP